jgi:hypothetical protein
LIAAVVADDASDERERRGRGPDTMPAKAGGRDRLGRDIMTQRSDGQVPAAERNVWSGGVAGYVTGRKIDTQRDHTKYK